MHQKGIINKLYNEFKKDIDTLQVYDTPLTSHHSVTAVEEGEESLNDDDQKKYQCGVGTLIYLTKFSRPDLSNAVRELSKNMGRANKSSMKQLKRAVKFTCDSIDTGLEMKPLKKELTWTLQCYSDSYWGGDKINRRSVTGWVILLNGCLISWGSKQQGFVTLSSSEA